MSRDEDIRQVAEHARRVLPLADARLFDEYYYQSLPLCVIDAVYSIGVRYAGVQNVVTRYCERFGLRKFRDDRRTLPPTTEQESITTFCDRFDALGLDAMTNEVFDNRQRTSTRSGILKAEAVRQFAGALKRHGAEYLQDAPRLADSDAFARDIRAIPGQGSGVSLQYFWMVTGSVDHIKPDRMVLRFIAEALGREVSYIEAPDLMRGAATLLQRAYPQLAPRLLDSEVWTYQRTQPVSGSGAADNGK